MNHLSSILNDKAFALCFLVSLEEGNPFGNHGLELKFPPVVIFTKWELKRKHWDDPRWVRRAAKGQTREEYLRQTIRLVFNKLVKAGVTTMPFFAAMNAYDA